MSAPAELIERTSAAFAAEFGGRPSALACAPGRVELLGNHTDYNGGLVMSAAIDRFTVVSGRPAQGTRCRVRSINFDATAAFDLADLGAGGTGDWVNYVKGVAWALGQEADRPLLQGFEASLAGEVPLGAGLSSSASLQASLGMFLLEAGVLPGPIVARFHEGGSDDGLMTMAHVLRRSENAYVGVASGLLDQFSSLFGRADHALFLDCRSLEFARLPLGNPGPAIVVCDSKTSRRLADGMYNRRKAECDSVVAYFRTTPTHTSTQFLGDLAESDLVEHWDRLDPIGRKRARHIVTENGRVRSGVASLRSGDLPGFGRLMSASHASSRDDFENSSEALDALIEVAEEAPGFLGGKLSGAGWAGCTVNLVRADLAETFAEAVRSGFGRRTGVEPDVHICHAAEGAWGRAADSNA